MLLPVGFNLTYQRKNGPIAVNERSGRTLDSHDSGKGVKMCNENETDLMKLSHETDDQ